MGTNTMSMKKNVIIVGSGASAVNAAWPLVEAGVEVLMLDFGNRDNYYKDIIPKSSFLEIRRHDINQHRYFLGDRFEGLQFGDVTVGAQLTPPRQYISALTDKLTPSKSNSFFFMESLAVGGLASGWGAGCFPYSNAELADFHLSTALLKPHYSAVARRIGVSGTNDDLLPFYDDSVDLQPPLTIDANSESILRGYQSRSAFFRSKGFFLGYPRLAVLSQPLGDRSGSQYLEMEFWADLDRSVYRPFFTLEELKKKANFSYRSGYIVERFQEESDGVTVHSYASATETRESTPCSALILAAGTFGTARIVLRSFNEYDRKISIVSNPYTYVPMLNISHLGKVDERPRHGLTQLCAIYQSGKENEGIVHAQLYSYRSLLNYKLLKEIPLPFRSSMQLVKMLLSGFSILGIHHEDRPDANKYCLLERSRDRTPDMLRLEFSLNQGAERRQHQLENRMLNIFRKLRCYGLKKIHNGHGSSIHYGGTFPINPEDKKLTVTRECLLRQTKSVYIADGSVFPYLPAKGPTFTMMANANRVGTLVRDRLMNE